MMIVNNKIDKYRIPFTGSMDGLLSFAAIENQIFI